MADESKRNRDALPPPEISAEDLVGILRKLLEVGATQNLRHFNPRDPSLLLVVREGFPTPFEPDQLDVKKLRHGLGDLRSRIDFTRRAEGRFPLNPFEVQIPTTLVAFLANNPKTLEPSARSAAPSVPSESKSKVAQDLELEKQRYEIEHLRAETELSRIHRDNLLKPWWKREPIAALTLLLTALLGFLGLGTRNQAPEPPKTIQGSPSDADREKREAPIDRAPKRPPEGERVKAGDAGQQMFYTDYRLATRKHRIDEAPATEIAAALLEAFAVYGTVGEQVQIVQDIRGIVYRSKKDSLDFRFGIKS